MALILAKGPSENIKRLYKKIEREGYTYKHPCGMTIVIPSQSAHVCAHGYLPANLFGLKYPSPREISDVILYYDPHDRIPLADGALIHLARTYFDDPRGEDQLVQPQLTERLRLIPRVLHMVNSVDSPHYIFRERCVMIEPGSIRDAVCHQCHKKLTNVHFEKLYTKGTYCEECTHGSDSTLVVRGNADYLATPSRAGQFLIDQIAIHFSIEMILFPGEMQLIFLIGNDYYISRMPIPARYMRESYSARKRLRITKKVIADAFSEHPAHGYPHADEAFSEFLSEIAA